MAVVALTHWQGKTQVADPVLSAGELAVDTTNGAIKLGDGTHAFSALAALNVVATAPSTAASAGKKGQLAYDATHIYVCIADNSWVRATTAAW